MWSSLVITFLQVDFKGIILPGIMGKWGRGGECRFFIQSVEKA